MQQIEAGGLFGKIIEFGAINATEFLLLTIAIPVVLEGYRRFSFRKVRKIAVHDIGLEFSDAFTFLFLDKIEDTSQLLAFVEDRVLRLENGVANLTILYGRALSPEDLIGIGKNYLEAKRFFREVKAYIMETSHIPGLKSFPDCESHPSTTIGNLKVISDRLCKKYYDEVVAPHVPPLPDEA